MIACMILAAIGASAQDVIVKLDKSTILAKVLKVSSNEIEYKKFSNPEGPTYTILISEIVAINYENGEKDSFETVAESSTTNVSQAQAQNQTTFSTSTQQNSTTASNVSTSSNNYMFSGKSLERYQEREELLKSARTNKTWGTVIMCLGIGTAVAGLLLSEGVLGVLDNTPCYIMIGCGLPIGILAGVILHNKASSQRAEANAIRVASIFEKDIEINGLTVSPGVKLMASTFENKRNYSVGLGATLRF